MPYLCCIPRWREVDSTTTDVNSSRFERVGVDILEMPLTKCGNRYVVVLLDYLTKWVEAFPLPDQTSESIARLLVDHVISHHGVLAVRLGL